MVLFASEERCLNSNLNRRNNTLHMAAAVYMRKAITVALSKAS